MSIAGGIQCKCRIGAGYSGFFGLHIVFIVFIGGSFDCGEGVYLCAKVTVLGEVRAFVCRVEWSMVRVGESAVKQTAINCESPVLPAFPLVSFA